MGFEDKIKHGAEDLGGKAKEFAGKATGNKEVEAEGKADQLAASVKDKASEAADKAKELAENASANLKAAADKIKEGFSN